MFVLGHHFQNAKKTVGASTGNGGDCLLPPVPAFKSVKGIPEESLTPTLWIKRSEMMLLRQEYLDTESSIETRLLNMEETIKSLLNLLKKQKGVNQIVKNCMAKLEGDLYFIFYHR